MTFLTEAQVSQILRQYVFNYRNEQFLLNNTIYIVVLSRENNQLYLNIWIDALSVNSKTQYLSYSLYRVPLGCDIDVGTINHYLFPVSMNKNSEGILWILHISSQRKAAEVCESLLSDFATLISSIKLGYLLRVVMPWGRDLK